MLAPTACRQRGVRLTGQNNVHVTVFDGIQSWVWPATTWTIIAQAEAVAAQVRSGNRNVGKAGRKGVPIIFGAYVGRIRNCSIAERVGVDIGDVIIQMKNEQISDTVDLEYLWQASNKETNYLSFSFGALSSTRWK